MTNPKQQSYKERVIEELNSFNIKPKEALDDYINYYDIEFDELQSFISQALEGQIKEVIETMWQVREDWRNDEQIQAVSSVDYLISLIKKA